MLASVLLFLAGLVLLLGGGDLLVRGASGLARTLGISPLIIGLTVVAFGTSAPELAVNLIGSWQGQGELSFGNIIGSDLANLGLILGVTVLFRPLKIDGVIIAREIPMMMLAVLAAGITIYDPVLRGVPPVVDRGDGLLLLLFFSVFLYYTIGDVVRDRPRDPLVSEAKQFRVPPRKRTLAINGLLTFGGLAALVAGGRLTVDAAVAIARGAGVPEAVIGLVLVGLGTSLPELATALIAAWREQTDLILGNVLGSNIFNTLLIFGVSSLLRPIPVPARGGADVLAALALSLLLLPFSITDRRRIVRWEGGVLLAFYVGYLIWRLARG